MLSELIAENIATIEKIEWSLSKGFTVLTGETGAGKSILIDSVQMLLGEKTQRGIVRAGAAKASVSGVFTDITSAVRSLLAENGIAAEEDNTLIVSRELSEDGRSLCRINGRPVTVTLLRSVGRLLVNMHGQHENQQLMDEENHLAYLDAYANSTASREDYLLQYRELVALRREIRGLSENSEKREEREKYLREAEAELKAAGIKRGEEEKLLAERTAVANGEKIAGACASGYETLLGAEQSVCGLVYGVKSSLASLTPVCPAFAPLAERLESAISELKDIAAELDSAGASSAGSMSLDSLEERLEVLHTLKLKYNRASCDALCDLAESAGAEADSLTHGADELEKKKKEFFERYKELAASAAKLTAERVGMAKKLDAAIVAELSYLDMKNVRFVTEITPSMKNGKQSYSETGGDTVRFLISANVGEEPKPLAKISSGGEISRLMLAVKSVLADCITIPTLIFDEIDTGVSGATASKIGIRMKKTAETAQVICVTHLAQIAAKADSQFKVIKCSEGGRTFSRLIPLRGEARTDELARIIGGEHITEAARETARELMRE